jgi:hypothetical protein
MITPPPSTLLGCWGMCKEMGGLGRPVQLELVCLLHACNLNGPGLQLLKCSLPVREVYDASLLRDVSQQRLVHVLEQVRHSLLC